MNRNNITHKELLAFSNLTNLEWEFVDLEAIKEGLVSGEEVSADDLSTQLNDLLTPEAFVRRDAEGEIERYVYMDVRDLDNVRAEEKSARVGSNASKIWYSHGVS